MAKEKSVKNNPSSRRVIFFRWEETKEYTVLEDFVVKSIELKDALSDVEIANILCLEEDDISHIIGDLSKKYPNDVQGDDSRRSLCDGFSRKLPDGIAVAVAKSDKIVKMKEENAEMVADFLDKLSGAGGNIKLNSACENFKESKNARIYVREISYNYNDEENPEFRCGDILLPEEAHGIMKGLLFSNKKPKNKPR